MIRPFLIIALALIVGMLTIPVLILLRGIRATSPGVIESRLMWTAKHRVLVGNRLEKNPLTADAETLADGKEAFSHFCVNCHGMDGQNTGVPFANKMSPPVPSLAAREIQSYTDGQLKWVIDNGIWPTGMPGSRGTLSDEEIWSIVLYLRHLPPAGSVGEPEMYSH
jgi:S-disulfanyl-L-cysteine oxidoreductase SoxD